MTMQLFSNKIQIINHMFGVNTNTSALFQKSSNSSMAISDPNASLLFGQSDRNQSSQTSNKQKIDIPIPPQINKQLAKVSINQLFAKAKAKPDAPKKQNVKSNLQINKTKIAQVLPVQHKPLLVKPNNENNGNTIFKSEKQKQLQKSHFQPVFGVKPDKSQTNSFPQAQIKPVEVSQNSQQNSLMSQGLNSSNLGIHSRIQQSGVPKQGGNLNNRKRYIKTEHSSDWLVSSSVATYQKLRKQQKLDKNELQIIQQNYSMVIQKQKDEQEKEDSEQETQKDKQNIKYLYRKIIFFNDIIDSAEKKAMKQFWIYVMVQFKFEDQMQCISLDGVMLLTKQHVYTNVSKYVQNNQKSINKQLFESGAFYKQNNEIKIMENSSLIKSIISNLKRLYFSYIQTISMIIQHLTDRLQLALRPISECDLKKRSNPKSQLQFIDNQFMEKMIFNCYQAFERASSFCNQQINNIQLLSTLKSLFRLYNSRGVCFKRILIVDFIRVVDYRYPKFAGKQEERLTTELAVKMVVNAEVIQQLKSSLTRRQLKQQEQPRQIYQAIKNIKNSGLKPLYWLLFQLDQNLPKPAYFIIEGSHFKPLVDQLIKQLNNKSIISRIFKQVLFRCICSILKEKATEFWQNEDQFSIIIEFLSRQLTLNTIQSHRKLAKVMECAMGKAPYQNAQNVLNYFIPYFIINQQNDNGTIFGDVFLQVVTGQANLQIREQFQMKDPHNIDTDHSIFSFLLKAIQGYPQAISMFSEFYLSRRIQNKRGDKKQIKIKICRALLRDYLLKLHQNQTQQMHQVFKTLNVLLQNEQTRSVALPIIELSDLVKRRKGQQILSKVIRDPNNYYILAEHLSLIFIIQEELKCQNWFNMINDIMNQPIQGVQMNQLSAYGKLANKYYESILKKEIKSVSKIHKEPKRGHSNRSNLSTFKINDNAIFMYFKWCFQMQENSKNKYQNLLLLRQKYQDLNQAVQLLKNILLIVNSPQLTDCISPALRQHIMLPNMNGRSQLELGNSRQTSYASALILLLKNSQLKKIRFLQNKVNPKFTVDTIKTISLLFMANQAYLRENEFSELETQSADNFYILNIYKSHMQMPSTIREKTNLGVQKSLVKQLTDLIKTQTPGLRTQLLINIPFSIMTLRDVHMLANDLMEQNNPSAQTIFSMSKLLTFMISRYKGQNLEQVIEIIKDSLEWLVQNFNRLLQNQRRNQQNIMMLVENIMNAILVANVESSIIFVQILKTVFPMILHPQNIKIQSKKSELEKKIYNRGLLIVFSSKSFLTDNQFRQIRQTSYLKQAVLKFLQELVKHSKNELLGLFCLKFSLDLRIYQNETAILDAIRNIQSEIISGQNAIGYTVFISMYCKNVKLPQIQMFINTKLNQKKYQNPLLLCCNPEIIQDKNLTLRLAQVTYQNYQMHPILHAAACSYFLRQILSRKKQVQTDYYEQSKEGTYLDILASIQRTLKNIVPSHIVIWNTTFMFYLAAWDSTFIDRIQSILFDNPVLMQRLSYLMNRVKQTQWMSFNNKYQGGQFNQLAKKIQGLNLIEKTQLFCLVRCLSAVYNHSQKLNKTSKKFVELFRSILRATSTIAALFSAKINVDSDYQSELFNISMSLARKEQTDIGQVQIEDVTVLDTFHQHLNIQIAQAYMIMLKAVLSFPVEQQRLNQEASLILSNQILKYYIKFQEKLSSNKELLEQIEQKYFKSVRHSLLLGYSNNFAVTSSIREEQSLLKKTMQLSLEICQKIGQAMSLSVHLAKFNKQFQKIYHRLREADIKIDNQFACFQTFETRSSNRLNRFQSTRLSDLP